jgi:hypothetical protein
MRLAALVAAGLVLSVSAVQAATITETASYVETALPTGGTATILSVAKFNGALGTLTSVTVSLTGTSDGSLAVRRGNNGAIGSVTYNATIGADYALSVNAQSLFVVDANAGVAVIVPRNTIRTGEPLNTASSSETTILTSGDFLTFFTGPGTADFALDIARSNMVDLLNPPNVNPNNGNAGTQTYTFANFASAQLEVIYEFTRNGGGGGGGGIGIPAPAALSLFSLSLLGLGLVGRARARA